jgi:tetratricopeptide (TPR) repeat protein
MGRWVVGGAVVLGIVGLIYVFTSGSSTPEPTPAPAQTTAEAAKPPADQGKPAEGAPDTKPPDAKPTDVAPPAADQGAVAAKPVDKALDTAVADQGKPAEAKPLEAKPAEGKPAEAKSEPKPNDKAADAKPTEKPQAAAAVVAAAAKPGEDKAGDGAPDEYAQLVAGGESAQVQKQLGKAESTYRKALKLNPAGVDAMLDLGMLLVEKKPSESAKLLSKGLDQDPHNARAEKAFASLGTAQYSLGHTDDATATYKKYLDLFPNGSDAAEIRSIVANLAP